MKTTLRFLSVGIFILLFSLPFMACDPEEVEPIEARITEFAITNAGAQANTRVVGTIDGLNIVLNVPFETDLSRLTVDISLTSGATVIPATGSTLDFSSPRNFVVTNGALTATYRVTVQKLDPVNPVVTGLTVASAATNVPYEVAIDMIARTITVSFNNLQPQVVRISNVRVLPAGATFTINPLLRETDIVDLAANPVINLSFAGRTNEFKFVTNITNVGFNPANTAVTLDRSGAGGLVPPVIATNHSRGAAFNGQFVVVPTRLDGNHMYYWDVNAPATHLSMSMTGVTGGTWVISDAKFVGNTVYASNMVNARNQVFRVYRWDSVTDDTPEVVLSWTVGAPTAPAVNIRIGDALSIIGDPATNGYIIVSNFPTGNPQNQFLVWRFTNGTPSAEPEIWTVNPREGVRIGQYGRINPIPGESNLFLVSGAEMGIAIMNRQGEIIHEIPDAIIPFRAHDPSIFTFNGARYLTYTVNREWQPNGAFIQVVNITDGATALDALRALTTENIAQRIVYTDVFGSVQDVWISAVNEVVMVGGRPRIMGFTALNGFRVVQLNP